MDIKKSTGSHDRASVYPEMGQVVMPGFRMHALLFYQYVIIMSNGIVVPWATSRP